MMAWWLIIREGLAGFWNTARQYLNCIRRSFSDDRESLQINDASVDHARADFFDSRCRDFCIA